MTLSASTVFRSLPVIAMAVAAAFTLFYPPRARQRAWRPAMLLVFTLFYAGLIGIAESMIGFGAIFVALFLAIPVFTAAASSWNTQFCLSCGATLRDTTKAGTTGRCQNCGKEIPERESERSSMRMADVTQQPNGKDAQ